ncbi:hypothetical protein COOONC_21477 [Cooperia oncophora]
MKQAVVRSIFRIEAHVCLGDEKREEFLKLTGVDQSPHPLHNKRCLRTVLDSMVATVNSTLNWLRRLMYNSNCMVCPAYNKEGDCDTSGVAYRIIFRYGATKSPLVAVAINILAKQLVTLR